MDFEKGYNDAKLDLSEGWVETTDPVRVRAILIGMMNPSESYIEGYLKGLENQ